MASEGGRWLVHLNEIESEASGMISSKCRGAKRKKERKKEEKKKKTLYVERA